MTSRSRLLLTTKLQVIKRVHVPVPLSFNRQQNPSIRDTYGRARLHIPALPSQNEIDAMANAAAEKMARLRNHFKEVPEDSQTNSWDALWQQQFTPWDRQFPNPALVETMQNQTKLFGSPVHNGKRKRALVPGCGRGYDVLFFASLGYDAWGLDASQTAVDAAGEIKTQQGEDPKRYPVRDSQIGRGSAEFLVADFFKDDFLAKTGGTNFDVIYDYTFLCALPPLMRPKWAKRMSELLSPSGQLICLEFPLGKSPSLGGPPHGLTAELYDELFARPGDDVQYGEDGFVDAGRVKGTSDSSLEKLSRAQAEKPHDEDRKPDFVSVWQHRSN
ncbi:Hypothetical protein R9X50_00430700 [Acrodontium crateriforme]|uniref:Thiol methyltransferase 2 n=1 Tax=Acrodontium crateriforme TaxID=150365 RepID=A0AAQ3R4Y8_9PEZI|nr:Hypothetical protein R9X50_00430700 [Acrodontium crateriforme]